MQNKVMDKGQIGQAWRLNRNPVTARLHSARKLLLYTEGRPTEPKNPLGLLIDLAANKMVQRTAADDKAPLHKTSNLSTNTDSSDDTDTLKKKKKKVWWQLHVKSVSPDGPGLINIYRTADEFFFSLLHSVFRNLFPFFFFNQFRETSDYWFFCYIHIVCHK